MPVGDCQRAFGDAARLDGVQLVSATVKGLTDAGHLALPASAKATMRLLRAIFVALGGNEDDLRAGTHRALQPDWFHEPSDTPIEVDEQQHFTTDRLAALKRYPQDAPLGFDRSEYIALCEEHRGRSDRYRSAKEARGFRRPGGRRAQRAYFDAVRDLAMPALGFAPGVRIPVFDDDGAAQRTSVSDRRSAGCWDSYEPRSSHQVPAGQGLYYGDLPSRRPGRSSATRSATAAPSSACTATR